jgi:bleomycin hydrolase
MRTFWIAILTIIVSTCLLWAAETPKKQEAGTVTPEMITKMKDSVKPDAKTQRLMDAVIKNDLKAIAINNSVMKDHNPYFSHEIKTGSITDQKGTGRCWLFAALNILRPAVIDKISDDSFEFSQNYLFFWDKVEKANTFLEKVIERRKLDASDEAFQRILADPVGDGGWWEYFVYLVKKYGAVPKSAMPETKSTENSGMMDQVLTEYLKGVAFDIKALDAKGATVEKMRQRKEEALLDVYRILCFHLGTPPTDFSYRYKSTVDEEKKMAEMVKVMDALANGKGRDFAETSALKDLAKEKVSLYKSYTPKSFADEYVKAKVDEYVVLANVPFKDYGKRYSMENSRAMVGEDDSGFLNVDMNDFRLATLQSVLSDEPVWFGSDVGPQRDTKSGIMNSKLYNYDDIYGIKTHFDKGELELYQTTVTNHAMAIVGVDLVDNKPIKWKVENSWGKDAGDAGFFTMYDNWFEDYAIQTIVNKKYLPDRLLALLDTKPVILKETDPFHQMMMLK